MSFLNKIWQSIYSPTFYSSIVKNSFGKALGYFLLFTLLVAIIQTIPTSGSLLINSSDKIQAGIESVTNSFPSDLTIKITKGQVSINQKEPYFIPLKTKSSNLSPSSDLYNVNNTAVIDTKTPYSSGQFYEYSTLLWVTKDSIFYKDKSQIKIFDLSKINDFTLNRDTINGLIQRFSPWFKFIGPSFVILTLLGLYSLYSFQLVYLFILALLILLLGKIFKWKISYKDSYKIGLHSVTLSIILMLLQSFLHFGAFIFMWTIINLVVVYINLRSAKI